MSGCLIDRFLADFYPGKEFQQFSQKGLEINIFQPTVSVLTAGVCLEVILFGLIGASFQTSIITFYFEFLNIPKKKTFEIFQDFSESSLAELYYSSP